MTKRSGRINRNWILLAVAGLFLIFNGGRYNFWLAAWISAIFFIRFTRSNTPFKGYVFSAAVAWVITSLTWYGVMPGGGIFHLINMAVMALISSLPLLLDRVFHKSVPRPLRSLVYPVFVTALEYILITGNPMGSFGSLAYTQYHNLPLIQIASLTGMMSITFIVSWFASVINELREADWKFAQCRALLFLLAFTLISVYGYGGFRLIGAEKSENSRNVAIEMIIRSEGNRGIAEIMNLDDGTLYETADKAFEQYISHSRAASQADIICWPEGAVITRESNFTEKDRILRNLSDSEDIYLIAPFLIIPDDGPARNIAVLYTPEGTAAFTHTKYGGNIFEGSVPGDGIVRYADTEFGRLSALICWDMDFPAPVLQTGKKDVDILFSPSSEWREIVPVHAQMAVFRGIENGVTTVHPASKGLSVIADPYGREYASLNWYRDDSESLAAKVSSKGVSTLYSRIGDLFPVLIQIFALVIFALSLVSNISKRIQMKKQ